MTKWKSTMVAISGDFHMATDTTSGHRADVREGAPARPCRTGGVRADGRRDAPPPLDAVRYIAARRASAKSRVSLSPTAEQWTVSVAPSWGMSPAL